MSSVRTALEQRGLTETAGNWSARDIEVHLLVTGVGMMRTAFCLGRAITENPPGLCINMGIAGSFENNLPIGSAVEVRTDCTPELGAEAQDGSILTLDKMGLSEDLNSRKLINPGAGTWTDLPQVDGITVNTVHGSADRIFNTRRLLNPHIETMEGAAVFYSCLKSGIKFTAVRTISNRVEPRNRDNWDITAALRQLSEEAATLIDRITA